MQFDDQLKKCWDRAIDIDRSIQISHQCCIFQCISLSVIKAPFGAIQKIRDNFSALFWSPFDFTYFKYKNYCSELEVNVILKPNLTLKYDFFTSKSI